MPLFSPVFNDKFFDKEIKCSATRWQLFKARLFGEYFSFNTEDGIVEGYRHNGIIYITSINIIKE
jgi:hypothetical protein